MATHVLFAIGRPRRGGGAPAHANPLRACATCTWRPNARRTWENEPILDAREPQLTHARYRASDLLGKGSQGVVFRVRDLEDPSRDLVAKMWTAGLDGAGIRGEFALLANSRIPGMVRAHDLAKDEITGHSFIVEDHIAGVDASEWLQLAPAHERNHRLGILLAEVAATLSALHDVGFVHGDLKPAHVRFAKSGRATLVDLGSAVSHRRANRNVSGSPVTRTYAAPELLAGARASRQTDLYSLGAMAYAIATGKVPTASRVRAARELAPWMSPTLSDLIDRLLAAHPSDRPENARQVLELLGSAHLVGHWAGDARWVPIGRSAVFEELLRPMPGGVRYLVGPSGMGKSHLARGLVSAAQVAGRQARLLVFGESSQ